jgi:hypothetical protein
MTKWFHICFSLFAVWLIVPPSAYAEERGDLLAANPPAAAASPVEIAPRESLPESKKKPSLFKYGRSGLQIGEKDKGRFSAEVNIRSQMRFSSPFRDAPRRESQFGGEGEQDFRFQRARFKVEGHAFTPWIDYKYEHDLVGNRLLDAQMTIGKWESLQFRFGQWKADYSRERMDSSGKQQFADRSIVNRTFTLDRQKGATVLGRLMKGTVGDSRYYVGVFAGNGRGFRTPSGAAKLDHSDGSPLVMARYQWNFLGRDVGHSQSDLEYNEKPAAALAFGAARNRSRYTRFSSSGGGQLDGFEPGQPGQYALRQFMEEATMKYRGLSLQHELHWKSVEDTVTTNMTHMRGAYVQAGYFFHHMLPQIPKQLEVGTRYAMVDPNRGQVNDRQKELAFVVNWFFDGHRDKVTFDTSRFSLAQREESDLKDTQVRLQWDVSF